MLLSKALFISTIDSLHRQHIQDKKDFEVLQEAFGIATPPFNNSLLVKNMLELLRVWFPKDEEGHCEIEFFCFGLDFGSLGSEEEKLTVENLWESLIISIEEKVCPPQCKISGCESCN